MLVAELVPLGRGRKKVLTGEGTAFALYDAEIQRYGIAAGEELGSATYDRIVGEVLAPRAKERALWLLQDCARTESGVRRKLAEGFYPREVIDGTMEFLRGYGLVDDGEYGRRYAELYGKRRSRQRVRQDLIRRGLDPARAEEILEESPIDEEEQIAAILRKKRYDPGEASPKDRRRIFAFLIRRGYPAQTVGQVIKNLDTMPKTV